MKARHPLALAFLPLFAVLGCGGSSSKDSTSVESKPATQILDDAAGALRRVHSFHLEGTQTIDNQRTRVKAQFERPSRLRVAFDRQGPSAELILTGGSTYIKANQAFWKQQKAGRIGRQLADKWFKAPTSQADLRDLTKGLDPATLSRCLKQDHGTLSVGGKASVDGQPAVVVVDKGDRPGGAPGKLFVSTKGKPLPLRVSATGNQRPGGRKDAQCNDKSSPTRAGDEVTFSRYDEDLNITAPPGAVDLTQVITQGTAR